MKKILITSGGTKEYIDDVRVLTNISTGKLGALIADTFSRCETADDLFENDDEIYYVHAKGAEKPICSQFMNMIEISSVDDLKNVMEKLVPEMDIVIHCMAVSDFGFTPCSTKLKSSDPQAFIDSLRDRIKMNPKILPLIKQWNPNCKLISFKFEVGLSHEELVRIAKESMKGGNSDVVIANDKTEMTNTKTHIAYAITNDGEVKLNNKLEIAKYITSL